MNINVFKFLKIKLNSMKEIRVLLFSSQEEKEIKISEWKIENGKYLNLKK
jgi:hypothetical protein